MPMTSAPISSSMGLPRRLNGVWVVLSLVGALSSPAAAKSGGRSGPAKSAVSARWLSAGGVPVAPDGRIALVKQAQKDRNGGGTKWTFPKGKVDPGESSATAAVRETREEAGLKVKLEEYLGRHHGPLHDTDYYKMSVVGTEGGPDHEVLKVKFVSVKQAGRMLSSARDRAVLNAFKQDRPGETIGKRPKRSATVNDR